MVLSNPELKIIHSAQCFCRHLALRQTFLKITGGCEKCRGPSVCREKGKGELTIPSASSHVSFMVASSIIQSLKRRRQRWFWTLKLFEVCVGPSALLAVYTDHNDSTTTTFTQWSCWDIFPLTFTRHLQTLREMVSFAWQANSWQVHFLADSPKVARVVSGPRKWLNSCHICHIWTKDIDYNSKSISILMHASWKLSVSSLTSW